MHLRIFSFILLAFIASTAMFFAGSTFTDNKKLTANILALADLQKSNASSDVSIHATSTPVLTDVLQQIHDQQQSLADAVKDIRSQFEIMKLRALFTRTLKQHDSGDDVTRLQEILRKVPGVYLSGEDSSDVVTGYYGILTKAAVMKFQEKEGLEQTGIFEQNTREKLFESAAVLTSITDASPEFVPMDLSAVSDLQSSLYPKDQPSPSANLTDLENRVSELAFNASSTQDQISQLASDTSSTRANVANLQDQMSQMASDISNIQADIVALQSHQPLPPILTVSNVQAINITNTSATITWISSAPATSEVDYSQNSSMPVNQTLIVTNTSALGSHSLGLSHLSGKTKYYYRVVSKDATGSSATSPTLSFTTL